MEIQDTLFADIQAFMRSAAEQGVKVIPCPRCGLLCKEGPPPSPDAMPLKRSTADAGGMCVNCALTDFIKSVEVFAYGFGKNGVQMMLDPNVQKHFSELFKSGNSDAKPEEIDWQWVVDHWDLPIPKKPRRKRHS